MKKHKEKKIKAYCLALNIKGKVFLDIGLISLEKKWAKTKWKNLIDDHNYEVLPITITY